MNVDVAVDVDVIVDGIGNVNERIGRIDRGKKKRRSGSLPAPLFICSSDQREPHSATNVHHLAKGSLY